MNHHKYACPNCGQHIAYPDEYAGREMPCPQCQGTLRFPGLPAMKLTSTLRLERDRPKPQAPTGFSLAGFAIFLREFKHWRIVGICLIPFALVAGAVVLAAQFHSSSSTSSEPATVVVDPQALPKLTDLTRADILVQAKLDAVKKSFQACENAKSNHAAATVLKRDDESLQAALKAFESAFANYRKLGGAIDYHAQLPR